MLLRDIDLEAELDRLDAEVRAQREEVQVWRWLRTYPELVIAALTFSSEVVVVVVVVVVVLLLEGPKPLIGAVQGCRT